MRQLSTLIRWPARRERESLGQIDAEVRRTCAGGNSVSAVDDQLPHLLILRNAGRLLQGNHDGDRPRYALGPHGTCGAVCVDGEGY